MKSSYGLSWEFKSIHCPFSSKVVKKWTETPPLSYYINLKTPQKKLSPSTRHRSICLSFRFIFVENSVLAFLHHLTFGFVFSVALSADMPPEKMLPFAAKVVSTPMAFDISKCTSQETGPNCEFVCSLGTILLLQAACGCRALGARSGLPYRSDPRLTPFLI